MRTEGKIGSVIPPRKYSDRSTSCSNSGTLTFSIRGPYFIGQLSCVTSHLYSAVRVGDRHNALRWTTGSGGDSTCDEHITLWSNSPFIRNPSTGIRITDMQP